jgi:hypothetical protein
MTVVLNIISALVLPVTLFIFGYLLKIEHRLTRVETKLETFCGKKEV